MENSWLYALASFVCSRIANPGTRPKKMRWKRRPDQDLLGPRAEETSAMEPARRKMISIRDLAVADILIATFKLVRTVACTSATTHTLQPRTCTMLLPTAKMASSLIFLKPLHSSTWARVRPVLARLKIRLAGGYLILMNTCGGEGMFKAHETDSFGSKASPVPGSPP